MSIEQFSRRAGYIIAHRMREFLHENNRPVQPAQQSFPSQTAAHQAMVASQYPSHQPQHPYQQQQQHQHQQQYQQQYQQQQHQQQQTFNMPSPPPPYEEAPGMDCARPSWMLPDASGNCIPDFSRVGYREGHVRIPFVPVEIVLEPSNSTCVDDTARIQAAIDTVGKLPLRPVGNDGAQIRGTVLLRAGVYRVAGALIINASGVVLRGEGQDRNGTVIIATGTIQRDFILINGMLQSEMGSEETQRAKARSSEMMPRNGYKGSGGRPDTYTQQGIYIPVGSITIPVLDTTKYNVGDPIVIERPGCDEWISDIRMDCLPPRPDTGKPSTQWTPKSFTFRFERRIVAIDQATRTFTIDIPMVMNLDPKYPPARIYHLIHKNPMISDVGLENLRLVSEYDPRNPEDEQHAWYGVVVDNTIHGWVADVTTEHFVSGIYASLWSRFITIQDCAVLDPISKPSEGGRRYQFNLSGQMGLVKRCFTNKARHDFITLGRVCGPNVFVDSTGVDGNNDTGPHERWAMGILYDNIEANTINIRERSWMGSGQGWGGVFHVVFNCKAKNQNYFQDAPGTCNWIIGFKGGLSGRPVVEAQRSCTRHDNQHVEPRSLYWSQLVARMGGDVELVKRNVGAQARLHPPQQCP